MKCKTRGRWLDVQNIRLKTSDIKMEKALNLFQIDFLELKSSALSLGDEFPDYAAYICADSMIMCCRASGECTLYRFPDNSTEKQPKGSGAELQRQGVFSFKLLACMGLTNIGCCSIGMSVQLL